MSTLLATLAVSGVNLLLNRQRLSWQAYSDEPLDPIPAQAQGEVAEPRRVPSRIIV